MVIYLRHAKHGTKVAIAEAEALADEKNGWQRYTPGAPAPAVTVNELDIKRRRRRDSAEGI